MTLEHQHRTVERIGERARDDQLAALMRGPGMLQMLGPELRAPLEISGPAS